MKLYKVLLVLFLSIVSLHGSEESQAARAFKEARGRHVWNIWMEAINNIEIKKARARSKSAENAFNQADKMRCDRISRDRVAYCMELGRLAALGQKPPKEEDMITLMHRIEDLRKAYDGAKKSLEAMEAAAPEFKARVEKSDQDIKHAAAHWIAIKFNPLVKKMHTKKFFNAGDDFLKRAQIGNSDFNSPAWKAMARRHKWD